MCVCECDLKTQQNSSGKVCCNKKLDVDYSCYSSTLSRAAGFLNITVPTI